MVGALLLIAFLIHTIHALDKLRASFAPAASLNDMLFPYNMIAGLMMLTTMIVAIFYCFDSLYTERRDRSILFWKSLPVSDLIAVLAKASVPVVILPVVGWAVSTVVQLGMAVISSIALIGSGVSVWGQLQLPRVSLLLLYHLITVHSLWWTPFFGWFLLVSAWARRTPILWGVLPIVSIVFLEKVAVGTYHFLDMLANRWMGGSADVILPKPGAFPTHPMTHMTPLRFFGDPGLWVRFAIFAVFLAIAVRLRKQRGPI
jgi:ABC-2 type transport system permease protein